MINSHEVSTIFYKPAVNVLCVCVGGVFLSFTSSEKSFKGYGTAQFCRVCSYLLRKLFDLRI